VFDVKQLTPLARMRQLRFLLTSCVSFLVLLSPGKQMQHLISGGIYWHVALLRWRGPRHHEAVIVVWYQTCAPAVGATERVRGGAERYCCCRQFSHEFMTLCDSFLVLHRCNSISCTRSPHFRQIVKYVLLCHRSTGGHKMFERQFSKINM